MYERSLILIEIAGKCSSPSDLFGNVYEYSLSEFVAKSLVNTTLHHEIIGLLLLLFSFP